MENEKKATYKFSTWDAGTPPSKKKKRAGIISLRQKKCVITKKLFLIGKRCTYSNNCLLLWQTTHCHSDAITDPTASSTAHLATCAVRRLDAAHCKLLRAPKSTQKRMRPSARCCGQQQHTQSHPWNSPLILPLGHNTVLFSNAP